ncbi:MAG: hypothetical protein OEZ35_09100 [Candidatus Bathyarchaeota archaeon]|nr:hypothetical protein [Candidatus Bathyarchaeota archaeon]
MEKKIVSGIMLTLLLISVFTFSINTQQVKAEPETVDIIYPQPGQFTNYLMPVYYPNGTVWSGWWNVSYSEYVQPHLINITLVVTTPEYTETTFWCTVNTTNRWVTDADPEFWWDQTWYVLWIETNLTVGSTINLWTTTATIVGDQKLHVLGHCIDCWIANASYVHGYYYLSYYDKISGLLVAHQNFYQGEVQVELTLDATNISIGVTSVHLFRLIRTIEIWNLPKGTENSLTSKLHNAINLLDKENKNGALHQLTGFIKQAEALGDKKLTFEQTEYLTSAAQRIVDLIEG